MANPNKFTLFLAKKIALVIIKWRANELNFKKAIKKAEELASNKVFRKNLVIQYQAGKRHYVYFIGGKYRVLNRKQIQYWRNKTKGVRVNLKVSEMTDIQLYDTMGHVNSHPQYTQISIKGIDIKYTRAKDLKTA